MSATLKKTTVLHQSGFLKEAEKNYTSLLLNNENDPVINYLLGTLRYQLGDLIAAKSMLKHAIEIQPNIAEAHNNLGLIYADLLKLEQAEAEFYKAIKLDPQLIDTYNNLANLFIKQGKHQDAKKLIYDGLEIDYSDKELWNTLGNLYVEKIKYKQALSCYDKALSISPSFIQALINRGKLNEKLKEDVLAYQDFSMAISIAPNSADAYTALGKLSLTNRKFHKAQEFLHQALKLDNTNTETLISLGLSYYEQGHLTKAEKYYRKCLAIQPKSSITLNNLANILKETNRLSEAKSNLTEAINIDPSEAEHFSNLGCTLLLQGDITNARHAFKTALSLQPDNPLMYSNFLFFSNYDFGMDADELARIHQEFGLILQPSISTSNPAHRNALINNKTLRIGLISADFRQHPTGFFITGVLANSNTCTVNYYCYSNSNQNDALTRQIQNSTHYWRNVYELHDCELDNLIRSDFIDILIDLSGHTKGNRLSCFKLKSAPIQMTWLGSCHTTGVSEVDYILLDNNYIAAGKDDWFTEQIIRFPRIRWCYTPPAYSPEIKESPVIKNGYITFGSLNNIAKLNITVLKLWADILLSLAKSKILISWKSLSDPLERDRLTEYFKNLGIHESRIILTPGGEKHADTLDLYNQIDIALDPSPFSGGLTSFEALWMGVPVITLHGQKPISRQTLSILMALGRPEWIAYNCHDYKAIALQLADDSGLLTELRMNLRKAMGQTVCDTKAFAFELETVLQNTWNRYCDIQTNYTHHITY